MKITCFGDSNVKRHQDLLQYGILSESTYILTYNIDELKESLFEIGEENLVIIHIMTNDVKYICHDQFWIWKSDSEKKADLICLAHDFVNMLKQLTVQYPDLKIIISMVLPRYDGKNLLKMGSDGNEIINTEISKHLLEEENVKLIKNCDMDETDFDEDKIHLSKGAIH